MTDLEGVPPLERKRSGGGEGPAGPARLFSGKWRCVILKTMLVPVYNSGYGCGGRWNFGGGA